MNGTKKGDKGKEKKIYEGSNRGENNKWLTFSKEPSW